MKDYPFAGKKLMTPGPVPLPRRVRQSLSEFECHHRSTEFSEVLVRVFENLKSIFKTKQHCYILAATGTGGLEAAMVNGLTTKKPFLYINAGKFGERWGKIAAAYNIPCEELKLPWGKNIPLNKVEEIIKKGNYQALAFQACETSTGALLPTQELAQICQRNNILSIVDGITGLAAVDLPMDKWGLDIVVGGSQKAFMLPTGMSFISLSEKAETVNSDINSYYFDLRSEKKTNMGGKTRYSTQTHFIIALDIVLDEILNNVGFDKHLKSISRKAQYFRENISLELFPETASPSLTCLKIPEGMSGDEIKKKVAADGFVIVGGQDQLSDKVLRVGHMGDISNEDLLNTARAIEKYL